MLFKRMKRALFPIACGLAGAALLLGASPASAHDGGVALGDRAYGYVVDSHRTVGVCDTRADGWGVRIYYQLQNGSSGLGVDNRNGNGSCVSRIVGSLSNPVRWIIVCAGDNGANAVCTDWRYVT